MYPACILHVSDTLFQDTHASLYPACILNVSRMYLSRYDRIHHGSEAIWAHGDAPVKVRHVVVVPQPQVPLEAFDVPCKDVDRRTDEPHERIPGQAEHLLHLTRLRSASLG